MSGNSQRGFTLIEVLAVVFLTTILFSAAVTYYVELSTRSTEAAETTRQWRHATALVDRVAADLERSYLVAKPAELDPLEHPWLFLAESRYAEGGADQLKFIARRSVDVATDGPRSDLSFVSYMIRTQDDFDGEYELLRGSEPGLPAALERDFPNPDDAQLVADGIKSFRLRFLDAAGDWHERWDSSQLEHTGTLPIAAEIEVAFAPPEGTEESRVPPIRRRVALPLPAIDLEMLTDPEAYGSAGEDGADGDGEDSSEDGDRPACECVDLNARDANGTVLDQIPGGPENAQQIADRLCEIPWSSAKQFIGNLSHPGVLCQ